MNQGTPVLYLPVGPKELALIAAGGCRELPPRLPEQPIFLSRAERGLCPANRPRMERATRFLDGIREHGLQKMQRHDVHLSAETKVTVQVGGRHGKPVLLTIRAGDMHKAGFLFRCSANGVWLVDHVPPRFIRFP